MKDVNLSPRIPLHGPFCLEFAEAAMSLTFYSDFYQIWTKMIKKKLTTRGHIIFEILQSETHFLFVGLVDIFLILLRQPNLQIQLKMHYSLLMYFRQLFQGPLMESSK